MSQLCRDVRKARINASISRSQPNPTTMFSGTSPLTSPPKSNSSNDRSTQLNLQHIITQSQFQFNATRNAKVVPAPQEAVLVPATSPGPVFFSNGELIHLYLTFQKYNKLIK